MSPQVSKHTLDVRDRNAGHGEQRIRDSRSEQAGAVDDDPWLPAQTVVRCGELTHAHIGPRVDCQRRQLEHCTTNVGIRLRRGGGL